MGAAFRDRRNENLSLCYSGLGTADIKRAKYPEAVVELNQAVQLTSAPDNVDLYLLGLADQMTNHFKAGILAFTKCAADPWKCRLDTAHSAHAAGTAWTTAEAPSLRATVGARGRQRIIDRWSWRHTAEKTLDEYRALLRTARG